MSVSQFSKDHGRSILGAGMLALAASIAFIGNGLFKRFDEVQGIASDVKATVGEVKNVQAGLRQDLATLRAQFPSLGEETGQAAAKGVQAFKKVLGCREDEENCDPTVKKLADKLTEKLKR